MKKCLVETIFYLDSCRELGEAGLLWALSLGIAERWEEGDDNWTHLKRLIMDMINVLKV
jgi:hypothetical protein